MKNIIKLRKTRSLNIWNVLEFKINNLVFTRDLFLGKFEKFWSVIIHEFTKSNHMFILFKIKYKGTDYATIGTLQRLNVDDKDWFFNWIINNMEFKSEYYKETPIESIIFSYGFKEGLAPTKENIKENLSLQNYKNNNLLISYNPLDYGKIITEFKFDNYTQFVIQTKEGNLINFKQFENYNEVEIFNKGNKIISYNDNWISDNKFLRILDNKKFLFENNKEILYTKDMKTRFISKLSKIKNFKNKFITFDIETFEKENILIPYLIRFYDGINSYSYWLGNYPNVEAMIYDCFKDILIRKYNRTNVYIHNLAKFDIIFLLKYLPSLGVVQPVIHNQRIISVNLNYGKDNEYQINFRDSYLILLSSLAKFCKSFNVKNPKSIFPHLFVNENNLNYIGAVPDFKYFIDVSKEDYLEYCEHFDNNWNLKIEAEKYCDLDCRSLYQVISKFSEMIYDLFGRSVHHYPTLPSLAFAIFRAKFMKDENIPQLSGKIATDIRSGYTGGAVDMYIPENPDNTDVFVYDVNALYPSQMHSLEMPIGTPSYFEGDIRLLDKNAFGFFYCNIIAPDDILHPILQTRVKIHGVTKTIAPVGSWEDMLFSEEMYNAEKYGYKFEILWGYVFKKENIFKGYVDFMFAIRSTYPKSDPMNFITKILMNSLYGRFGMNNNFENIEIIHKDYYPDFENKFIDSITDKIELDDYILIFYNPPNDTDKECKTSVGIAAATTAYSRIHMSQFKNNPEINLYYTDTDSIYTDSDIDKSLIDNKILGKLKLENVCNKAIFLAPKLYCLESETGEIIVKVKGLKDTSSLNYNDFKNLLTKNFIVEKYHKKWFRKLRESKINIISQIYSIKVTDNKRLLVYDNNNKLIGTQNYKIDKNKII